jgi:predicted permease
MDYLRDVSLTIRYLLKRPGYASAVVAILALAIAATSGIFSAVHAVLLAPLPIANPTRLVVAWLSDTARNYGVVELSYREFEEWRDRRRSVSELAVMGSSNWTMVLDGRGDPVRLPMAGVSAGFFEVLGARPLLGRSIQPQDDLPNAAGVIVLNHGAWVRRFGADPGVVGATVTLDEKPYTIVGVMPPGFDFPRQAEFWTPVVPILAPPGEKDNALDVGVLFAVGRLREGVTTGAATEDLNRIVETRQAIGAASVGSRVAMTPFLDYLFGPVRAALWLLLAAVAVLMLIACANISALMLARVSMRRREHSIRLAVGATPASLGRLWMFEIGSLSIAGGSLGFLVGGWMTAAIVALAPDDIPRLTDISMNVPVALFTAAAVFVTALLCGLAPVRQASAANLVDGLNDAARGTPGRQTHRSRSLLLVFQMAFAVVLLVGAGLVVRSFDKLRTIDLGFSPYGVVTMQIDPRSAVTNRNAWFRELRARVEALPGVETAGTVYLPPLALGPIGQGTWVLLEGQPDTSETRRRNPLLNYQIASPGYFGAMRIPLRRGRLFDARDDGRAPRVAMVGANTAQRLWPGEDPVGKRLGLPTFVPGDRRIVWRTVVGVVAAVRYKGLDDDSLDVYEPADQAAQTADHLVLRTDRSAPAVAAAVQTIAKDLDPRVVVDHVTTLEAVVSRAMAPWRLSAWMFTLFAAAAAVLAAVGLFSLLNLETAARRQEFAVRIALGALRRDIVRLVLTSAAWQIVCGVGAGLVIALVSTRALRSLLFGVQPIDAMTYVSVSALVLGLVGIASYVPARRAAGLDPATLLRRN